jgi:enterochelin esterase family protein
VRHDRAVTAEIRLREVGIAGARAPLLVVLDGPDYVRRARLFALLRAGVADGAVPPHRVALVSVGDRLEEFSASTRYARQLVAELEQLGRARRVGLGSSLGALALFHAHRIAPRAFAGLFLQSGSFFRRRTDPQERRFPRFGRIDRFVAAATRNLDGARPVPTTITCALDEENYANNTAVARALATQDYPVDFHAVRGGHDWPTWKRTLEAHLPALLREAWR